MKKKRIAIVSCIGIAVLLSGLYANLVAADSVSQPPASAKTEERSGNQEIIVHTPPQGWSPLRASALELDYYAYPPRPSDPQQLAQWKEIVSGKWERPIIVDRKRNKSLGRSSDPSGTKPNGTHAINTFFNYAGWVKYGVYTRVTGFWTQAGICFAVDRLNRRHGHHPSGDGYRCVCGQQ